MPRQAHGRSLLEAGPSNTRKRKPAKGRGLNALETAEKQFPDQIKIRQHRLGEAEGDDDTVNTRQDADERSSKRRRIDRTGNDLDSAEEGSDPDGNSWHVGVDEDDEDSDLDSDEAFGQSDEERFHDFTFRGSANASDKTPKSGKKKKPSRKALDLAEDNGDVDSADEYAGDRDVDAEEDDLGEDAIDLAAAWDLDDEEEREEQERAAKKQSKGKKSKQNKIPSPSPATESSNASAESSFDDESESEDQDDVYEGFSASDGADEDTTARLQSFVNALTPAQKDDSKVSRTLTRRSLPEKPSQFALSSAGLSAADLMQYVKDPTQRQSLKIIQAAEREEPTNYKGGIPGKLAAPLAKRQQDRLDRVAAYDQSKNTMERWVDTVKQNRRADHVSFPLADAAKDSASNVKSFQPLSKTEPQSELESKIQQIMQESGFNNNPEKNEEEQEQQYEELREKKIPLEEVQARRRELRMQRELMFREEVRAKRIKKIKSKAFRRVHRKERDKFAVQERERLGAAGMIDSEEERERNDRQRAEERMGARHRESKWAKAAKATGQTTWNEDAKSGVSELARRDEELRRRVDGRNVRGSDESNGDSDSESEYSDSNDEDDKWNAKLDGLKEIPHMNGKSKLADMAFMKKAEAERKAQNDEELRLLRRNMNGEDDAESGSDSDTQDRSLRLKYGTTKTKPARPVATVTKLNDFEERLSEDEDPVQLARDTTGDTGYTTTKQVETASLQPKVAQRTRKPVELNGGTAPQARSSKLPDPLSSKVDILGQKGDIQQTALDDYTSPSESEGEQNDGMDAKDRLALDIFAGDDEADLRKQFEKEKREVVEEEGDHVVDNTLPGWGSWTGVGVSKREQKKARGRFLSVTKGVAPEARKDAKLERVIVNEKRVKKNGKYLATELPHPFESRQQYERSLRLPMGPEWSTRNHFQDAIKPRILMKQGQVIKPMAKPII